MKALAGLCLSLLLTGGVFAQNRSGFVNAGPPTVRTFPSAVFPGGSSALPGVQRTTGSVVFPGGGTPQIGIPGIRVFNPLNRQFFNQNGNRNFNRHEGGGVVTTYGYPVAVPVPVYVGGGSDASYYDQPAPMAAPVQQAAPNVIVIYPPAPGQSQASMMMVPQGQQPVLPQSQMPDASAQPAAEPDHEVATHYLIAFKDHSIYSAVAYWVDGDTLHYFTTGNTHNQVSLSLVDRDLTKRLNDESGLQVNLPSAK